DESREKGRDDAERRIQYRVKDDEPRQRQERPVVQLRFCCQRATTSQCRNALGIGSSDPLGLRTSSPSCDDSSSGVGQNSAPTITSNSTSGKLRPSRPATLSANVVPPGMLKSPPSSAIGVCITACAAASLTTSWVSVRSACCSATSSSCSFTATAM